MSDETGEFIETATRQLAKQVNEAQEAYLVRIFGSFDNALAAAKYFVIEDHGWVIEEDVNGFRLISDWKLRPKTAQEIAADLETARSENEKEKN